MSKLLLDEFLGKRRVDQSPPIWMMRQAGRYLPEYRRVRAKAGSFLDLCYNPELACEVSIQPVERFKFDGSIIFSDILVVPDALDMKVEFIEGKGPLVESIENIDEIEKRFEIEIKGHLEPMYEAIRLLRKQLDKAHEGVTLIGFCGAPFTVATYIIGKYEKNDKAQTRLFAYEKHESYSKLMDLLVDKSIDHLNYQIEAGAEVVQIFDSWASALPYEQFIKWSLEPITRIVEGVKKNNPNVPIIGFPKGVGVLYKEFSEITKVDGIGVDYTMPLDWINDNIDSDILIQGNLDPLLVVSDGGTLEHRVKHILNNMEGRKFIFNLGHGLTPQSKAENVQKIIDIIRS